MGDGKRCKVRNAASIVLSSCVVIASSRSFRADATEKSDDLGEDRSAGAEDGDSFAGVVISEYKKKEQ